jgi:hypothetical protein
VDGTYVNKDKLDVIHQNGGTARVPVMWGTTADDGAAFVTYNPTILTRTHAINSILYDHPVINAAVQANVDLFPVPDIANTSLALFNLTARIATDAEFRCIDQVSKASDCFTTSH